MGHLFDFFNANATAQKVTVTTAITDTIKMSASVLNAGSVSARDGGVVGLGDGDAVGLGDGVTVGLGDGDAVGDGVEAGVGAAVGAGEGGVNVAALTVTDVAVDFTAAPVLSVT